MQRGSMIKSAMQTFADIKAIIDTELNRAGITGWIVAQNYNPVQGHWNKPTLVMHRVRDNQYGAIEQQYTITEDKLLLEIFINFCDKERKSFYLNSLC